MKKKFYKKWWFWLLVVVVIGAIGSQQGKKENEVVKNDPPQQNEQTEQAEQTEETVAKIGDILKVGDIVYTVNSIEYVDTVGSEYINKKAQGKFLVIDITVLNNSDKALQISDSFFTILNDGKKFEGDSTANIYISTQNNTESIWINEINPEISLTGKLVFDVPQSVVDSTEKQLHVQTGYWGTQTGVISLK